MAPDCRVVERCEKPAGQRGIGAQAAVVELDEGPGARGPQALSEPGQTGQVLVGGDAELTGPRATAVSDVGGAGLHRGEPTAAAGQQPLVLGLGQCAVVMALLVGHRCEHVAVGPGRAVSQFDAAVGQVLEGGEGLHGGCLSVD